MAVKTRRPTGDGYYTDFAEVYPTSPTTHYDKVDEAVADDDTTLVKTDTANDRDSFTFPYAGGDAIPAGATSISVKVLWRAKKGVTRSTFKGRPFLRFNSTNNDGTQTTETTSYADHSETITKPGGGAWSAADINSANWEAGVLVDVYNGVGSQAYVTQLYVEITYTDSVHPAPTSLECDRVTTPTNVGDTPIFTAIFNATGGSGTADRAYVQVSEKDDFSTTVWDSGYLTIVSVSHGNRCAIVEYNGTYLSSYPTDGNYYWRIKFKNNTSGVESYWSDNGAVNPSEFSGINRDWADADYPFRRKLTFDDSHAAVASGNLVKCLIKTGNRRIIANNGNFNESVQASGGFSMCRWGGKTHIVYLSKLDDDTKLGIWVVTIDHVTGEVGDPYRIIDSGTSYDTHYFPVIDAGSDGYLHIAFGCHYGYLDYLRSTQPGVSGSLSGDPASGNWDNPMDAGATGKPAGYDLCTYPILFTIPHTGRIFIFYRLGSSSTSYRYRFVYSDDSGETWSGVKTILYDQSTNHYRLYCYGVRYDSNKRRLHLSWTHNHTGDSEKGVWYCYCDYDDTDGSSLDVGFNICRWADGTIGGYTDSDTTKTPMSGWTYYNSQWQAKNPIATSADELSLIFTETLVLTKGVEPLVFYEQKLNQGSELYAAQTNVVCAKWSAAIGSSGSWQLKDVSDQTNTLLRVRRSSLGGMADRDGTIHLYMPVLAKTEWRYKAIGDKDAVGTISRASGVDNYAMIDEGFTHIDQSTWIKLSSTGAQVSFNHSTSAPSHLRKIFSVTVRAILKCTATTSYIKLYLDNGTTDDMATQQMVSSTITEYSRSWTTNPFTASAWAENDLTGLEFGVHRNGTSEVQIYRVYMEITYTRAADDEYFDSEIYELVSSDDGDTWTISERSRNTALGVPIMNHKHNLSGDMIEVIWSSGNDIFYLTNEPYGMMLPTGQDFRLYYGTAEIDRLANYFNVLESTIYFKLQDALAENATGSAKDYYLYFGNRNLSDWPKGDPDNVYDLFDSFEEWGDAVSITSWTIVTGTANAYSSPPHHAIKRYAGKVSLKTGTSGGFEAYKAVGSGLTNVYIQGAWWYEGSGGKVYIAARDSAGNEFRVGQNDVTSKACYYDGTWHDHSTKVCKRANSIRFALLITSSGCTAWADGVKICDQVTRITSVDQIRLGQTGGSTLTYFDFIRLSHSIFAKKDETISSGFTDSTTAISSARTSAYNATYDAKHDHDTRKNIWKLEIKLSGTNNDPSGSAMLRLRFWLCNKGVYDPGAADVNIDGHFGGNNISNSYPDEYKTGILVTVGSTTYKTFVFDTTRETADDICNASDNTTDYYAIDTISRKSFKLDYWVYETDSNGTVTINEIKVYYEDHDPIVVNGDLECRGFYSDAALLGSGVFQFNSDSNIDETFIRDRKALLIENGYSPAIVNSMSASNLKTLDVKQQVVVECSKLNTTYLQCTLENLMARSSVGQFPLGYSGTTMAYNVVNVSNLRSIAAVGPVNLEFVRGLNLPLLTPIEYGLEVAQGGQLVAEWQGIVTASRTVQIESLRPLNINRPLPLETLASVEATNQEISEWLNSKETSGRVLIGYLGSVDAEGIVNLGHLVLLSIRNVAAVEFGEGKQATGLAGIETGVGVGKPVIVPISFVGSLDVVNQAIVEAGQGFTYDNVALVEAGRQVLVDNQVSVEMLKALSTSNIVPVEYQGMVTVEAFGQMPIEWRGGFKAGVVVPVEAGQGIESTTHQVPLEFRGSVEAKRQLVAAWLSTNESAHQVCMFSLAAVETAAMALVEYGESKYAAGQLPINVMQGLEAIGQLPVEWQSAATITAFGNFPIEWRMMLQSTGQVRIENLKPASYSAIYPVEFGSGLLISQSLLVETKHSLANIIEQVSIESVKQIATAGNISIEHGTITETAIQSAIENLEKKISQLQVPMEWQQFAGMTAVAQLPISWVTALAVQQQLPIESQARLEIIGGNVLIDWGVKRETSHRFAIEYGEGITVAAQVMSGWLQTIDAHATIYIESKGQLTAILRVEIEYGRNVITSSAVPIETLYAMRAEGQLPMDWVGFLVTLMSVANASLKLPGALGARIALPSIKDTLLAMAQAKDSRIKVSGLTGAALKLVKAINAKLHGG